MSAISIAVAKCISASAIPPSPVATRTAPTTTATRVQTGRAENGGQTVITKIFQKGVPFSAREASDIFPPRARHRLFPLAYATVCISNSLDAALANANRSSTPPVRADAPRTPLSVVATGATPASS